MDQDHAGVAFIGRCPVPVVLEVLAKIILVLVTIQARLTKNVGYYAAQKSAKPWC